MAKQTEAIVEHILSLLHRYGGKRHPDGADKLMGGEHGVTGWDGIYVLEDLEEAYGIDLRSFADAKATTKKHWFLTYTVPGDVTPLELAEHIAGLIEQRASKG